MLILIILLGFIYFVDFLRQLNHTFECQYTV